MKKLLLLVVLFISLIPRGYALDSALEKAKLAIQAYFDAILTHESTLSPNIAMSMAVEAVEEKDRQALQDHYDQISLSAARQAIDAYAKVLSEGKDASAEADTMHQIEDALSPENRQEAEFYYKQKSINAAGSK